MAFHGLAFRVGLPILLLVLVETIALAVYMTMQVAAEARSQLERLAAADAAFIAQASLPLTEGLARDLQRVTGFEVFFRGPRDVMPAVSDPRKAAAIERIPADGSAHADGDFEFVAVPLAASIDSGSGRALVLARALGGEAWDPRILQVLGAFWLLAIVAAWLGVRSLVRPLRRLTAHLPAIENTAPIDVPEATRPDEIGDLARAFIGTRQALHAERELRARMEKTAMLGRMTASLAHEVQNPVAAIQLHAQLLRDGDPEGSRAAADVIEREAARIDGLISQWLFLTRPEPPALLSHDLGEIAAKALATHRAQLEHSDVEAALHRDGDATLLCDARRLGQVVDNLVVNAIQAMPNGGALDIRVATAGADDVHLSVADRGTGFSESALSRSAEFFYSEKEGGMGIGLGVATEIVRAHGGTLAVANRDGGGAVVTVTLPRRGPDDPPTRAAPEESAQR